jgi:GT2 family glycosyltransferase
MRTGDDRVSIVMITHNRREEVLHTLSRLAALPEEPYIVVVDTGSSDDTPARVIAQYPTVQLIAAGANLGAAGRTLGVQHVQTPYVAFCDDDTWWRPGALRRAADLFDAHPRLTSITGRVLIGPEEREDPTCQLMQNSPVRRQPGMPGPALLGFLAGASVVRRGAFLGVGGFRTDLFLGGEEEWVAVDLAARGWWLCYVPELIVHHYPSPQRDGQRRRGQLMRNALCFAWLRRPMSSALRRTVSLLWRSRWDRATLHGVGAAVSSLPGLLQERRVVPPHVEEGLRRLDLLHKCE